MWLTQLRANRFNETNTAGGGVPGANENQNKNISSALQREHRSQCTMMIKREERENEGGGLTDYETGELTALGEKTHWTLSTRGGCGRGRCGSTTGGGRPRN